MQNHLHPAKILKLLFVCRGNTCRSPMAECIMQYLSKENDLNWKCDSAGLRSWNVGRKPDDRCMKVLDENGMTTKHYGRKVIMEDFKIFDYILGIDEESVNELQLMADMGSKKGKQAKIIFLGSFLGNEDNQVIKDPFFSRGISSFRNTYDQIFKSCEQFIAKHKIDNSCDVDASVLKSFEY